MLMKQNFLRVAANGSGVCEEAEPKYKFEILNLKIKRYEK